MYSVLLFNIRKSNFASNIKTSFSSRRPARCLLEEVVWGWAAGARMTLNNVKSEIYIQKRLILSTKNYTSPLKKVLAF